MASDRKSIDAVKEMRKVRDRLSRQFRGKTPKEQKEAMSELTRPKPRGKGRRGGA